MSFHLFVEISMVQFLNAIHHTLIHSCARTVRYADYQYITLPSLSSYALARSCEGWYVPSEFRKVGTISKYLGKLYRGHERTLVPRWVTPIHKIHVLSSWNLRYMLCDWRNNLRDSESHVILNRPFDKSTRYGWGNVWEGRETDRNEKLWAKAE